MNATGPNVPAGAVPGRAARDRRRSPAARAAGLAFLPLPLVPFVVGLASVIDDPNRPGSSCFEYCEFDRDLGRLALALGVVGIWLAVMIWRRHVAAMALALFVAALLTAIWSIAIVAPVLAGQFGLLLNPLLAGVAAVLIALDSLLAAALGAEMIRAGEDAVASLPTVDPQGPTASS